MCTPWEQFLLVTQGWTCLGRSAPGAAFEHGDSSRLFLRSHLKQRVSQCQHSHVWKKTVTIKLETALDYCGCPAPPPPRAPPEPNTRPDGSLALPGGSTACYGSVCGQESGEEFPATLAGVGVGLPNSGSASCQILPAGQELHPARGVWPFSLRSADSSLLSSVPRPTSYTMWRKSGKLRT